MKILLLRLSSMGDIILTQSVVAELRQLYPQAQIHYCSKSQYADLVRMLDDELVFVPYSKSLGWHLSLLKEQYDILIDLHGKFSTWLIRCIVPARRKATYSKQRRLRKSIVNKTTDTAIESTVRLYYSAMDKLFNNASYLHKPLLHPKLSIRESSCEGLPERIDGKKLIAIFVGAAHPTKTYPIQLYRELLSILGDRYQIWLLGDNQDREPASILAREFSASHNLCGRFGFAELAQVVAQTDLVISGDTGPMHMAAALGRKQIAIFGGTHPKLGFAPLNESARILCANLPCQPCSLHGLERCPLKHFRCMLDISPQRIVESIEHLIGG